MEFKNLIVVFVFLLCFMGYLSMTVSAELDGEDGKIAVSDSVIFRQGDGINYTFAENESMSSIELMSDSILLNNWLEIKSSTSAGFLTNDLSAFTHSRIEWNASCTAALATVGYTVTGLDVGSGYVVEIDGVEYATSIPGSGQVSFVYAGHWSSHTFAILEETSTDYLWLGIILTLALGISFTVIGMASKKPPFSLVAGLIWIFGGVFFFTSVHVGFAILSIGMGTMLLLMTAVEYFERKDSGDRIRY
ncbi:MAG: hypothetical protein A2W25_11405 [candidate division Zixibacteria bacterium RBG_16_53_22]|nr:MAG: hypothetical protein A2W25_11405 [candidate division Zixibacteria bacterium RBG_16_53_22]